MSDDAMWAPDAFASVCAQRDAAVAHVEALCDALRAVLRTIDAKQFAKPEEQWARRHAEALIAEVGK
jgi:hypothetical protein